MRFANPAGANEQDIVVSRKESSLRQLQEPSLGETRHQGKIKVLQAFLVGKGRGFEPLTQLLLMTARQFPFQQRLQKAQIAKAPLSRFTSNRFAIARHP